MLGLQQHDIAILVVARVLQPIGNRQPNGRNFFAAIEINELAQDQSWVNRERLEIQRHWHVKNRRYNFLLTALPGFGKSRRAW